MKVAVLQIPIIKDFRKSLDKAFNLISYAGKNKAEIIVLPELFAQCYDITKSEDSAKHETPVIIEMLKQCAKIFKTTIIGGSVFEKTSTLPFNTTFAINHKGIVVEKYKKIHLFDINRADLRYSESKYTIPGEKPTILKINRNQIGLSICNDLRFPELFRNYALKGAFASTVISAFTHETGKHHWHTLLRARAIENQMYILASNMSGKNKKGLRFFGHSMIIDPWGKVLAEAPASKDAIIFADIKPEYVKKIRREIPTLKTVNRKNHSKC